MHLRQTPYAYKIWRSKLGKLPQRWVQKADYPPHDAVISLRLCAGYDVQFCCLMFEGSITSCADFLDEAVTPEELSLVKPKCSLIPQWLPSLDLEQSGA